MALPTMIQFIITLFSSDHNMILTCGKIDNIIIVLTMYLYGEILMARDHCL